VTELEAIVLRRAEEQCADLARLRAETSHYSKPHTRQKARRRARAAAAARGTAPAASVRPSDSPFVRGDP
jgi:hypothetical protein